MRRDLLIRILLNLADSAPVRWADDWRWRILQARRRELLGLEPMTLRSVLPWGGKVREPLIPAARRRWP